MKSEFYFESVTSKLISALNLDGYGSLAKLLDMSPSAFANRKKSGSLPYEAIIELCRSKKVSLDWVFSGCPSRGDELDKDINTDLFIKIANRLIELISNREIHEKAPELPNQVTIIHVDCNDIDLLDFAALVCYTYNKCIWLLDGPDIGETNAIDSACQESANSFLLSLKIAVVKKGRHYN